MNDEKKSTPVRLWLAAQDVDGEHAVWFDPDEGGTAYIRIDLYERLRAELTWIASRADDRTSPATYRIDDIREYANYALAETEALK